jgi:ribonucleoside-triphosphate reductase
MGTGFEANDNANLQENAETSHKKKADKMSKEQYLLMLPPKLADAHLNGDIHIHDLEYLGTRAFCLDSTATIPMIMNGEFSFGKAGDFDAMFQKPEKIEDRELVDVSFLNIKFFGPRGCRRLLRVYRKKTDEKILALKTNLGKTLRLSKDHPLIVCENGALLERRAGDTKAGTALATGTPLLFGTLTTKINLVRELCSKATAEEIENVYARGLGKFFEKNQVIVSAHGQLQKQWRTRGIMPISRLAEMTADWGDEECEERFKGITLGVTGSEHVIPAIFEMTPEIARLTGYFVSEGNYNVVQGRNYNLVITNGNLEVIEDVKRGIQELGTYTTVSTQPNGAQQIFFGGKLIYLLFRRVLGIPEGAASKRIPAKFFCMEKKISDEFLSTYLTGYGAFAYRKEKSDALISFTTQSEGLKTDLLYLLAANGIVARAYTTSSSTTFSTGHEHISNVWRVAFNGENVRRFLKFSTFLDEKISKAAAEFLEKVRPIKAAFKEERVVEMQEVDATTGYLYDFVLEGTENEEHVFMAGDGLLVHNCQDWDLRYFFYYGLMPDGSGTKASVAGPAKKAEVAILHAVKALGSAQTNFAGGQGFYNFLGFIAPYFEGMSYDGIEQLMQMFVYEMTQMMVARGGQLVFSSVQLSPGIPKLWRDKPVVYKGKVWDGTQAALRTYGEFEREVRLGFEALMNVMLKGDYWGKPFNFPKPEISIEPDFMEEDEEFNRAHSDILSYDELYTKAFELAAKYGAPYFDNQLPEYRGAGKGISCYQCCAYNFSSSHEKDSEFEQKLYFKDGKHFSMGAWQVVSINCPRAAYKAQKNDEALFRELKLLMDESIELFKVKRKWMDIIVKRNRMPFATQRPKDPITMGRGEIAVDLSGLVYTIGVVGINEMVQHHTGKQIYESEDARRLAIRAMFELKFYAKELSEKYGMEIALARTPAETTAQRFAVSDLLHNEFRKCAEPLIKGNVPEALRRIHQTRDLPIYYTNGTHVPPSADVSLPQRIKLEETFFPIVDGGNILHIWLGEAAPDPHGLKEFAMNIAKNTQVGYFAFTKDMTVCMDDFHVASGLLKECPNCESENVEHLSRVTGYIQAVSGWNEGKKQELKDRKRYGVGGM